LIVGSGAVQNSWQPIVRALQPYHHFPATPESVNLSLARIVYLLRWYSSTKNQEELAAMKRLLADVRHRICEQLTEAQQHGELAVRKEFGTIVNGFILSRSTRMMLVNTNWDTAVDDALERHLRQHYDGRLNPVHIHGSVKSENTLYLPTEVVREPYRSADEDNVLGTLHGAVMHALEDARWVVLYGISLSPLDAELVQTLAAGFSNPKLEQIDLIVPDHALVSQRVNVLLDPRHRVRVFGYDPSNLASPVEYSLK
jgi:hypothetical protein